MKKNRIFIYLIGGFIILCLLLKITKTGILVSEGKTTYYNQGTIAQTDCTYFTGMKFQYKGAGYGPSKNTGKPSCPLLRDMRDYY
jgi:hypothetical protein